MTTEKFLFEVSWEVCNPVGGIHTVLLSKLTQALHNFGGNYILIGPLYEQNKGFVTADTEWHRKIEQTLAASNIVCRVGYWDTAGKPTVILVDYKQRHKIDTLLYSLWTDFGVDSLASNYDYHEPILFATAAGEVICALSKALLAEHKTIVAQFHEWMCGAGLLHIKKYCNHIATVFTTHATVLGRAIANDNKSIYNLPANFDPTVEAKRYGVFAKHSMEVASAREADSFTTVSCITADEANIMLAKYPDKVVLNGLDIKARWKDVDANKIQATRIKLLQIASQVVGKPLAANALLWITSGRYEFHNKGYDVLLRSLAQLQNNLPEDAPPIVVFILLAVNWRTAQDSLLNIDINRFPDQRPALGIATHRLYNAEKDSIINLCHELNLQRPDSKIHVVFSDAYLHGTDGVFDMPYEQILAACGLSIFPSFYEPWGYTPLESIAYATPTVTTDLAGFGFWVNSLQQDHDGAIQVLQRKDVAESKVIANLTAYLAQVVKTSQNESLVHEHRARALQIAELADWQFFYQEYLDAYTQAFRFNELYHAKFDITDPENACVTSIHEAETLFPRFRSFQYESPLPEKLSGLRTLAYNFWWSWHEDAKALFQKIDPQLWEQTRHNPAYFLNLVSTQNLQKAAADKDFVWQYNNVICSFNDYIQIDEEIIKLCTTTAVSAKNPIAYFCMEYGIDECLPIYSGGLGILAGDFLKAMSDLKVPLVAVGLFYKQGYFHQKINARGEQEALYETWDPNQIPMKQVNDADGKPILIAIEILGRTVYAAVWEVKVGHIDLYLLDTNVAENSVEDRAITNNLYGGSREIRLMQEIILGIGGERLLAEKLNITPALYHLNEGHSTFLLLERIRELCHKNVAFATACEIVRSSSVFTTHTPVPAGNEAFPVEMIRKYMTNYAESIGITIDQLLNLASDGNPDKQVFSMTALAMRLTLGANAVSTLHGQVARNMWQNIWPGLLEQEIPIDVVTNGVHLPTWLGAPLKLLFDDYLPNDWSTRQDDSEVWERVHGVANGEMWKVHQTQKERLLDTARELITRQYTLRNESRQLINASLECLNPNNLVIGLSRRFTGYKRNDLFLRDKERLARILNNEKRPVVILIAGKAHPADGAGQELVTSIIATLRQDIFKGRIIFLEEYNIGLAKLLVQGVDVWLNTPILGHEACGTSGMKVGVNGGLNFSTKDGWWEEAYSEQVGWEIDSLTNINDLDKRDDMENRSLLDTLENKIIPLYYSNHNRAGFNPEWVEKMKASIALVACRYNTSRMVRDYVNNMYCPIVLQNEYLLKSENSNLREIVAWKQTLVERFNTVKIKAVMVGGIRDGKITSRGLLKIKLLLFAGKMSAKELRAEFVLVKSDGRGFITAPVIIPLQRVTSRESGVLTYTAEYQVEDTGFYSYGVRVLPFNSMLFRQQDAGVVYWG